MKVEGDIQGAKDNQKYYQQKLKDHDKKVGDLRDKYGKVLEAVTVRLCLNYPLNIPLEQVINYQYPM